MRGLRVSPLSTAQHARLKSLLHLNRRALLQQQKELSDTLPYYFLPNRKFNSSKGSTYPLLKEELSNHRQRIVLGRSYSKAGTLILFQDLKQSRSMNGRIPRYYYLFLLKGTVPYKLFFLCSSVKRITVSIIPTTRNACKTGSQTKPMVDARAPTTGGITVLPT